MHRLIEFRVQHQNCLHPHGSVLGGSERDHVDSDGCAERTRPNAKGGSSVGDARPIKVDEHSSLVCPGGDRPNLVQCVHRAQFSGLGDGDSLRLHMVGIADPPDHRLDPGNCEFAIHRLHIEELGSGESFRGTTFIDIDVRIAGAHDRLIRPQQAGKGNNICTGAVEHGEYADIAAELCSQQVGSPSGDGVISIRGYETLIGGDDGCHHLRMNTCMVVTCEACAGH